jgi:hypothetical protein
MSSFAVLPYEASALIKAINITISTLNTTPDVNMSSLDISRITNVRDGLEQWIDTLDSQARDFIHGDQF